jgi:flagellar export protein FliJ
MKPFRFPLQSLRVLRQQKERAAQQRYAHALKACEEAAARVRATSEELNTCWTTLNNELASGVTGVQLLRTRAWCNVLELKLKERTAALEKARLAVDAAWQEMMLATRDRESLDRFHDKSLKAHDRELQRVEQNNLDELAVQLSGTASPLRFTGRTRAHQP